MITGYEAFCLYQSLKLHFTTDSYDFFKYGGKSKTSLESFDNRKDKYHFHKLSRRLSNKDDLTSFIVANFLEKPNLWVGDLLTTDSETIYRQRQKVIQSMSYIFENDCRSIFNGIKNPNEVIQCNGDYPILLLKELRKEIQIESICLLNNILNFLPMWKTKISDDIRWPIIFRKYVKYSCFLPTDMIRYKHILKKVLKENEESVY